MAIIGAVAQLTKLEVVNVVGATSPDQLKSITQQAISRQWFGSSLLLVNSVGLRDYILKAEPVIEDVQISRQFPHTLLLKVKERQSGIRWKSGGVEYLLDNTGMVVGESRADQAKLPIVSDSKNLPVKAGDRVVPGTFIAFVNGLSRGLAGTGIKAGEASVPESSSELHLQTDKGYFIKFDTTRSSDSALADLKVMLGHLGKLHRTPAEYIDLRIPGKGYYR